VPAWCDRVLIHELDGARKLHCTHFGSCDALSTSDHAPVGATLELRLPPPVPESEPLYQCVVLLADLKSSQLDVGGALGARGDGPERRRGQEGSTLKLLTLTLTLTLP